MNDGHTGKSSIVLCRGIYFVQKRAGVCEKNGDTGGIVQERGTLLRVREDRISGKWYAVQPGFVLK